jgi:hypothetical protein
MRYWFVFTIIAVVLMPVQAAQVSGAIFTTTANGSRVNANHYSSKCEAYLDGGPGPNAPAKSAGLPDGLYYFQVTDPSGKTLLSTDVVANRQFRVTNGVIVAYTGVGGPVHPTGYDQDHPELGAITIRLGNANCPADYSDSQNGTYKVWATPATDFAGDPHRVDNDCGAGCFHGFLSSKSKTDNFRVSAGTSSFCLTIWKRIAGDVETPGARWKFYVTDPVPIENTYFTAQDGFLQICGLTEGYYSVRDDLPPGWSVDSLDVNGMGQNNQPVYSFYWSPGRPEPVIIFKNSNNPVPLD